MEDQGISENSSYRALSEEEFQQLYLLAAKGTREDADAFFNRFKYKDDLLKGNPVAVVNEGMTLLIKCREFDENVFNTIHKGSAYYWMGIAAYLAHEIELATFFFDASVTEDIKAGANPSLNGSPSIKYMMIDGDAKDQYAKKLVKNIQVRTEDLINEYNARFAPNGNHQSLTINDIRNRFLRPAISAERENLRSLATTFISFIMEWDFRYYLFDVRPNKSTAEPFLMHLFKGCVLFESLLKGNEIKTPPIKLTLGQTLQYLHNELQIPNDIKISDTNLGKIISDLDSADNSIQTSIQFTGRIRNSIGHNLGWDVNMEKYQYKRLFGMISSSCLHAIAYLYH